MQVNFFNGFDDENFRKALEAAVERPGRGDSEISSTIR